MRLIGFGRYAGIVGAYNGFRAIGLKKQTFQLPKAATLVSQQELIDQLKNIQLPNLKIALTGNGKVARGAKEMLDAMHMNTGGCCSLFDPNIYKTSVLHD